jgi:putative transposase
MSDQFATLRRMKADLDSRRLWEHLKADLKWSSFKTLSQLQTKVDQLLSELTPEVIASITGYPFILDALSALNTI